MNIKVSSVVTPRLYVKKSLKASLSKKTMSTMDLFDEESLAKNVSYCLTSAYQEHSILNDLLNSNLFNDSITLNTTTISNRNKLNQKTIDMIKEAIKYHLTNVTLFPIFRFNKGYIIVFHDQKNKLNNFVKEFNPYYSNHYYIKLLSRLRMRFTVINVSKVAYLMKILDKHPGKYFGKLLHGVKGNNSNANKKGKKLATMNPIITMELLTKIPNKHPDKIIKNRRLEMQYGKAKEAAIGIRRLEYAYNMKKGFMFNKMLFQNNVITIQKWWRSISRCIAEFLVVSQIQSHYRGHLSRIALYDSLHVIDDILPLINRLDNIIIRNKIEFFYNRLYRKYAYLAVYSKMGNKIELIKRNIRAYINKKVPKIEFRKQYVIKCNMLKHIYEINTQKKIDLIQSSMKFFLMNHNDKIMRKFGYYIHPYLYFKLKYEANNKETYKKKKVKFHRCLNKLQLLNLRVNKKIPNAFESLRIAITKKYFKELLKYDKNYVYWRKNYLIHQFVSSLVKELKQKTKYLNQWFTKTKEIIKKEKIEQLEKIIKTITTVKHNQTIEKYYYIWKTKKSLVYQMVLLFKKSKIANKTMSLNQKKRALFNELFNNCNWLRNRKREIELRNAINKWKNKAFQYKKRDSVISKILTNTKQKKIIQAKEKAMSRFINKCNAKKRESIIKKTLLNKTNKEYFEVHKCFEIWKKHYQYRIFHSIFNKTSNTIQNIMKIKLSQLNEKCTSVKKRNSYLRNCIEYVNDFSLLKQYLVQYRNKIKQLNCIEELLSKLVYYFTLKHYSNQLRKYNTKWRILTKMNRVVSNMNYKWLLNHLYKWKTYSYLINSVRNIIAKRNRLETISIRKYFNQWRKYNKIYIQLILPFYQTKTKLFVRIVSSPINKMKTVHKTISFYNIFNKGIETKAEILSKLKNAILSKHNKDIQKYTFKWKEITNDIIKNEKTNQRINFLLKTLFSNCTVRFSSLNLNKYFSLWRIKAPYYLRISVLNKTIKSSKVLNIFYLKWKKKSIKYKLNHASNIITNRVRERNHFKQFCSGLTNIFIKKLIHVALLIKKKNDIKMMTYKSIFKKVVDNIGYRNQLKSLTRLSSIANRKFKLSLQKWRLKTKRITLTQKRFYLNANRRIETNYKKEVLYYLLAKVKNRRETQKGKFFKKFKKAAGVYYIKCSRLNFQVFFLYRQKKYLSKRKYRMLKYVINQMNRKLIKHQSLKKYLGNWRKLIRFSMVIDFIDKRVQLLEKGIVALRVFIKKWFMN